MSARIKNIEQKVKDIVLKIKEEDIEIYHIEYVKEFGNYYIRVFIDKDGGVFIDDCESLSRVLSEKLDEVEDMMPENYILEVCSPGIDRVLHSDEHYEKAIGEKIFVKSLVKIDGKKEHIGVLVSFDDKVLTLEDEDKTYTIEREKVTKANIYFV